MTKNEIKQMSNSAIDSAFKLEGTNHDQRRKLTTTQVANMKRMANAGKKSLAQIAEHFGVSTYCVRYNTDEAFKEERNALRVEYPSYTEVSTEDVLDRVNRKRELALAGKLK